MRHVLCLISRLPLLQLNPLYRWPLHRPLCRNPLRARRRPQRHRHRRPRWSRRLARQYSPLRDCI